MLTPGLDVPFNHSMKIRRYVYIPTRDGTRIACDVYRPEAPGRFPCLLVQTPYNKNNFDAASAARYVGAGYVLCVADLRGTGGSEGEATYHNVLEGAYDGADCVEWLASQEYSRGNVGTFGGSALGIAQIVTAKGRPEHLKAMFVQAAPLNYYVDRWFPGGISNMEAPISWQDGMTGRISPAAAVEDASKLPGEVDPEGEKIRKQVRVKRFRRRFERSGKGHWTALLQRFLELRNTAEFTGIWHDFHQVPFLAECEVPTHYTGVWYDHFIRSSCESFLAHKGPAKLTVQPGQQGTHGPHADLDMTAEHIRWFDYWLKGIDNGVMDEPAVRLFVMGLEEWRGFDEWPPAAAKPTLFLLSAGNALRASGPAQPCEDTIEHDPDDPLLSCDVSDVREYEQRALVYTTDPLQEDLAVIGSPRLRLRVRCSGPDGHLFVKLCDVFPDGRSRQVTNGRLRLTHREGHDKVVQMPQGEAVPVEIELWPTANTFKSGHCVRLVLAGSEAPLAQVFPEPVKLTVLSDHDNPSALDLPVLSLGRPR